VINLKIEELYMANEMLKQWAELNKTTMQAMKELGEINTKVMTRLTEQQMEVVGLYMDGGTKQLEGLSEAKGVQDAVASQSKLFSEMNEKLVENARKTMDILADTKAELAAWAEKGMGTASTTLLPKSKGK
jgi:phasin family protein